MAVPVYFNEDQADNGNSFTVYFKGSPSIQCRSFDEFYLNALLCLFIKEVISKYNLGECALKFNFFFLNEP